MLKKISPVTGLDYGLFTCVCACVCVREKPVQCIWIWLWQRLSIPDPQCMELAKIGTRFSSKAMVVFCGNLGGGKL